MGFFSGSCRLSRLPPPPLPPPAAAGSGAFVARALASPLRMASAAALSSGLRSPRTDPRARAGTTPESQAAPPITRAERRSTCVSWSCAFIATDARRTAGLGMVRVPVAIDGSCEFARARPRRWQRVVPVTLGGTPRRIRAARLELRASCLMWRGRSSFNEPPRRELTRQLEQISQGLKRKGQSFTRHALYHSMAKSRFITRVSGRHALPALTSASPSRARVHSWCRHSRSTSTGGRTRGHSAGKP